MRGKRAAFYIDEDDSKTLSKLKREEFFDTSYSEMYRTLIRLGAESMLENKKKGKK